MTFFPVLYFFEKNWKIIGFFALLVACFASGWMMGSDNVQTKWDLAVAKQETKVLTKVVKQTEVTTKVVTQYVDRVTTVKEKGDAIIKEVPIYVTTENDSHCTVPVSFGVLWNAANTGEIPKATGATDETTNPPGQQEIDSRPSTVLLSDISRQHIEESTVCRATEEQLKSLQQWVREQYNLDHPEEPLPEPEIVDPSEAQSLMLLEGPGDLAATRPGGNLLQ
jgi:hypothetical protein